MYLYRSLFPFLKERVIYGEKSPAKMQKVCLSVLTNQNSAFFVATKNEGVTLARVNWSIFRVVDHESDVHSPRNPIGRRLTNENRVFC